MMNMRPPQPGHGRGSMRGFICRCSCGRIGLLGRGGHGEQLARPRDVGGAIGAGQQPVVADAMESPLAARASGSGG